MNPIASAGRRRGLIPALVVAVLIADSGAAWARLHANFVTGSPMITSGATWSALTALPGGTAVVGGAQTVTWSGPIKFASPIGQTDAAFYFDVVGAGTVPLTGFTLPIAIASTTNKSHLAEVWLCSGATWNTTTNTCGGTITLLGSFTVPANANSTYPVEVASSLPISGRLSLLFTSTGGGKPAGSYAIGIQVSRSLHVRAGEIRNG